MTAFGRKQTFSLTRLRLIERPLSVRADIRSTVCLDGIFAAQCTGWTIEYSNG
jgi:hypothetical protein